MSPLQKRDDGANPSAGRRGPGVEEVHHAGVDPVMEWRCRPHHGVEA